MYRELSGCMRAGGGNRACVYVYTGVYRTSLNYEWCYEFPSLGSVLYL